MASAVNQKNKKQKTHQQIVLKKKYVTQFNPNAIGALTRSKHNTCGVNPALSTKTEYRRGSINSCT